ncbi:hypothetical protein Pelo_14291 [Pelomyxa schiedti]|nr:hypothetical protein Pelo_14291 [Pelomyxa schiedti]
MHLLVSGLKNTETVKTMPIIHIQWVRPVQSQTTNLLLSSQLFQPPPQTVGLLGATQPPPPLILAPPVIPFVSSGSITGFLPMSTTSSTTSVFVDGTNQNGGQTQLTQPSHQTVLDDIHTLKV